MEILKSWDFSMVSINHGYDVPCHITLTPLSLALEYIGLEPMRYDIKKLDEGITLREIYYCNREQVLGCSDSPESAKEYFRKFQLHKTPCTTTMDELITVLESVANAMDNETRFRCRFGELKRK